MNIDTYYATGLYPNGDSYHESTKDKEYLINRKKEFTYWNLFVRYDDGEELIITPKLYSATIQWHDNKEIRDHMFIKIGDIEDDDDDIFFYMESEEELKEAYKDDFHEWKILECKQIED